LNIVASRLILVWRGLNFTIFDYSFSPLDLRKIITGFVNSEGIDDHLDHF
jgi:hypothetical protein